MLNRFLNVILKLILAVLGFIIVVIWFINAVAICYSDVYGLSVFTLLFIAEPCIVMGLVFALYYSRYKSMAANIVTFVINTAAVAGMLAIMASLVDFAKTSKTASAIYPELLIILFIAWYVVLCLAECNMLWCIHKEAQDGMRQSA